MRSELNEKKKTIMNVHRTHTLLNSFVAHHLAIQQFFWHPAFSTLHRRVSYILNSRGYAHWQSNVLAKLLYPSWRTNACLPLRHAVCSHFVVQVPGVFWQKGNWANRFSDVPDKPSDFHLIYSWWYFWHTIELSYEQMFSVIPSTTPSEFPIPVKQQKITTRSIGVFPPITTWSCV